MDRLVNVWYYPDFVFKWTEKGRELQKLSNSVQAFNQRIIELKRKQFQERTVCKKTKIFLDYLIETEALSDEEILDEVSTFIVAVSFGAFSN